MITCELGGSRWESVTAYGATTGNLTGDMF